jgi:CheY-like chemotaxis protein
MDTNTGKSIGSTLLISQDEVAIRLVVEALQELALAVETSSDISEALDRVNHQKFEAVFVDTLLGNQATYFLERLRASASNRTAVAFAITASSAKTGDALRAGASFALQRPLTPDSISNTLKAAYGLIVRERRRYFRYPVSVPAVARKKGELEVFGSTVNVSERGMAFSGSRPLTVGVEVTMEFALTDPELTVTAQSIVRWHNARNQSGLSFVFLTSDISSELQGWLARKLEEQMPGPVARRFQ